MQMFALVSFVSDEDTVGKVTLCFSVIMPETAGTAVVFGW